MTTSHPSRVRRTIAPGTDRERRPSSRPRWPSCTGGAVAPVAGLVIILSLAAPAAPPSGPVLGTRPSGIVNEQGAVVGGGPPLTLTGPPADAREQTVAALRWLQTYLEAYNALERDMVKIRMALRSAVIQIKELTADVEAFTRTRDRLTPGGAHYAENFAFYDNGIKEKQAELAGLKEEQDALIAGALQRWDELARSLAAKIDESSEFPDFQKGLRSLATTITQKRQLGELELRLAAGHSREFDRLATRAEQDKALRSPVLLMRVADYMERGDGRSALYAARLGLERYPENAAFRTFAQGLETSYLKSISAKAAGDAAGIRKAWEDYAGEVPGASVGGYVKQFFFGGLRHTLEYWAGKTDALEALATSGQDRGVMEHNGIELMLRLHDKGLGFDQIRGLNATQLRDKMTELFHRKEPISETEARGLALAVQAAFRNPDVTRLLKPSKEQFDLDMGRSYYGAEEFDHGLLEYAVDAINVKNALLFFGPSAVVSYAKAGPGLLGRVASKFGAPEKLARALGSEFEGAVTVRDLLLSRPTLQQAASFLGNTRVGASLGRGLETLRYLRYDASAPVRFATGVAEGLAQIALFEVGGKVGHALGGDLGEFVGQALVMLAGNPVADLQERQAKALEAVAQQMARTRTTWEATNRVLKEVELPVGRALEQVLAGRALTAAELAELDAAAARATGAAAQARAAAAGGEGAALQQAAADRAEALKSATDALKAGDVEGAQMADDVARKLAAEESAAAEGLAKAEGHTLQIAKDALENAKPQTSKVQAPPTESPPGVVRVEQEGRLSSAEQHTSFPGGEPPPGQVPPSPPSPPPPGRAPPPSSPGGSSPPPSSGPTPLRDAEALGDDAMRAGNFAEAEAHYRTAVGNPQLSDEARALLRDKVREARQAVRYEHVLEQRGAQPEVQAAAREADQARQPFTAEQRQRLQTVEMKDTREMTGTMGGPRKVIDPLTGETVGIWKPKSPPSGFRHLNELDADGQALAEVLAAKAGRKLGLRVPHAEPWVLRETDAAGQVIAQHEGVLIRWIPGAKPLADLTPGARAALKAQLARLRPFQVLLGNYDIHMGNYVVDRAGRVWAIDAGMAQITTPGFRIDTTVGGRTILEMHGDMPHIQPSGDDVLDWTRVWRDWYAYRGGNPVHEEVARHVRRLDDLLQGGEMREVAEQIKRLTDDELGQLVREVMGNHGRVDDVLRTLKGRRDAIGAVLEEKWAGAAPRASTTAPSAPRSLGPVPSAGAEDLVYGLGARGQLRALQERVGGKLLTDLGDKPAGLTWEQWTTQQMDANAKAGRKLYLDLTHMEDVPGVLAGTGPHAGTTTGQKLRHLRGNRGDQGAKAFNEENVIFLRQSEGGPNAHSQRRASRAECPLHGAATESPRGHPSGRRRATGGSGGSSALGSEADPAGDTSHDPPHGSETPGFLWAGAEGRQRVPEGVRCAA